MMSGARHFILGRMAIIDRMQANKGKTPFNIKIPKPSRMEAVKPIKILGRLETMLEGNCVTTKNVREMTSMAVSADTDTSSWKIN